MKGTPLTEEQRRLVIELSRAGMTQKEIAAETGLGKMSVYRILAKEREEMKLSEIIGQTSPVDMKLSVEIGSLEALVERQKANGVLPESMKRNEAPGRGAGYWLTESQKRENRRSAEKFESMVARFKAQSAKPAQVGEKVSEPEQSAPKAEQPQENPPVIEAKAEQQPEPASAPEPGIEVQVATIAASYSTEAVFLSHNSAAGQVEICIPGASGTITLDTVDAAEDLRWIARSIIAIAERIPR